MKSRTIPTPIRIAGPPPRRLPIRPPEPLHQNRSTPTTIITTATAARRIGGSLNHQSSMLHLLEDERRVLPAEAVNATDGHVQLRVAGLRLQVERVAVDHLPRVDGGGDLVVV